MMVISLLVLLGLGYFRVRLTQSCFSWRPFSVWKIFFLSLMLLWALLGSEMFIRILWKDFTSFSGISYFFLCLLAFLSALLLICFCKRIKESWFFIGVILLSFWLFWTSLLLLNLEVSILILCLSVIAEELLKVWSANIVSNKYQIFPSDFLLFSLLLSVWFSFFENCYYLITAFFQDTGQLFTLSLWRGIFSSLIHFLSSGMIAVLIFKYCPLQQQLWKKIWLLLFFFWCGILFHFVCDYRIHSVWIYVILLILGYFFLTYILYLSDQLYLKK